MEFYFRVYRRLNKVTRSEIVIIKLQKLRFLSSQLSIDLNASSPSFPSQYFNLFWIFCSLCWRADSLKLSRFEDDIIERKITSININSTILYYACLF
jgi:hypothetical protein